MKRSVIFATCLALQATNGLAQTSLHGTILSIEGKELRQAVVGIDGEEQRTRVGADGSYLVTLDRPGIFHITASAPGYADASTLIYIDAGSRRDEIRLDFRLGRPLWYDDVAELSFVVGRETSQVRHRVHDNLGLITEPVVADNDTTWFKVEGYEPWRNDGSRIVRRLAPSAYDVVRRDPLGLEFGIVARPGDTLLLSVDLRDRITDTSSRGSSITIGPRAEWVKRIGDVDSVLRATYATFHSLTSGRGRDAVSPSTTLDSLALLALPPLRSVLMSDPERRVRAVAAGALVDLDLLPELGADELAQLRDLLTSRSTAWVRDGGPIEALLSAPLLSDDPERWLLDMVDHHPDRAYRDDLLLSWYHWLARGESSDDSLAAGLYERILSRDSLADEGFLLSGDHGIPYRNQVLALGERPPTIRTLPIDGGEATDLSLDGMGRTLIDFWSPGRISSSRQMASLRDADSLYGSAGLRIISIAVDGEVGTIREAMQREGMNWEVRRLVAEEAADVLRAWGIDHLPARFLVRSGEIIDLEYLLSHHQLLSRLAWEYREP